jgi:hypothetical protein
MAKESWAAIETRHMSLKDKRRNERVRMLLETITDSPESSISQACHGETAAIKGAYRLIGTTEIDAQDILEGHYQATVQRTYEHDGRVIILSDGMDISFTNLKKTTGLGTLANSKKALGIKTQNTYVFSEKFIPLGLINQKYWVRNKEEYGKKKDRIKLNIKEKESYSWIDSIDQIEKKLPLEKGYVFIGDGAADIYDLFALKRRKNSDLLIHLVQNRKIKDNSERLFESLSNEPILGIITQKLDRTKKHPERTVTLEVRVKEVEILSPSSRKSEKLPTIKLTTICAQEVASDKSLDDSIVWRLITTIKVDSIKEAEKLIVLYSKRWLIERYHYILKEGFRVEKLQMESADNLKRALALYSIAAWRLLHITYLARIQPDAPCSLILTSDEADALYCIVNKTLSLPPNPVSVKEATKMIAKLGGFLGRKGDKEPGAKVLWQGLYRLESITQAYVVFKAINVGNG